MGIQLGIGIWFSKPHGNIFEDGFVLFFVFFFLSAEV